MQTKSRPLPRLFFLVALLIFLGVGCASRSGPTPQQFADQYKALMISYRDRMQVLAARPMPPETVPRNKKQHRALLAQQVDDIADAYMDCDGKLKALRSPTSTREIQSTTDAFFKVSADDYRRWADAMRGGNRDTADRAYQRVAVDQLAGIKAVQQASRHVWGPSPKLQNLIDEQQRELNRPQPGKR